MHPTHPSYSNSFFLILHSTPSLLVITPHPTLSVRHHSPLPTRYITSHRYLPEPLVLLLRSRAASASLACLDEVCETPELIWTAEMQLELRAAVASLLAISVRTGAGGQYNREGDNRIKFQSLPSIAKDFIVSYRQLQEEIQVGNVYIRLYLKQPTFRLSNPIFFLEKLIELWDHSFNKQVPLKKSTLPIDIHLKGDTERCL